MLKKIIYQGSSKIILRLCETINALIDGYSKGDGHIIVDKNNSKFPTRANLQFMGANIVDDSIQDTTLVSIPTNLSAFTNDANFINSTVNNLTNYYLKAETYTKSEINSLISSVATLNIQVVRTLPTTNISQTTIYLVPKALEESQDIYDEYINTTGTTQGWERIGSTQVDLSNYYTKSEITNLLGTSIHDGILTIKQNGVTLGTFTANQDTPTTIDIIGSGGSTIIPNPEGEPTETLMTIQIGDVIYKLEGGGGGGSAERTYIEVINGRANTFKETIYATCTPYISDKFVDSVTFTLE